MTTRGEVRSSPVVVVVGLDGDGDGDGDGRFSLSEAVLTSPHLSITNGACMRFP
jgi:hypothetical protein